MHKAGGVQQKKKNKAISNVAKLSPVEEIW